VSMGGAQTGIIPHDSVVTTRGSLWVQQYTRVPVAWVRGGVSTGDVASKQRTTAKQSLHKVSAEKKETPQTGGARKLLVNIEINKNN